MKLDNVFSIAIVLSCLAATVTSAAGLRRRRNEDGVFGQEHNVGPDTCGQDRTTLSTWYLKHGQPRLLLEPIPPLVLPTSPNPYKDPSKPPLPPSEIPGFCAMQWSTTEVDEEGLRKYRLAHFPTVKAAVEANYTVTHKGMCGSCSTLQDLGVYIGRNLTSATRKCGFQGIISTRMMTRCLQELGFSANCIPIWEFNILNTRRKCFGVCLKSWIMNEPFNKPDGSLNNCLQCDEDNSGPNFKYYSGRTRRNSGIPSSIHRPDSQVYHMQHCYWYGNLTSVEYS